MNRTEMIYELRKYLDWGAFSACIYWNDETLAALLALNENKYKKHS